MPKLKKKTIPSSWYCSFFATAGRSSSDFFVLADSSEYNEYYRDTNPPTIWSPTSYFTHILHFKNLVRHKVCRVPDRLTYLWWCPSGTAYAVGYPPGIFQINASGCREVALNDLEGSPSAIWGTGEDHLFVCGGHETFVLYRHYGTWLRIPLPDGGSPPLWGVAGLNERDVYFVGDDGTIVHFDGKQLRHLDSPTTRHLTAISPLDDQHLCIGGYGGVLLFGNRKGWRFVPSGTDEPLQKLARLGNQVCFATPDGVWAFDGQNNPTLLVDQPAGWVDSAGDAITVHDYGKSWVFDGQTLTPLDTVL